MFGMLSIYSSFPGPATSDTAMTSPHLLTPLSTPVLSSALATRLAKRGVTINSYSYVRFISGQAVGTSSSTSTSSLTNGLTNGSSGQKRKGKTAPDVPLVSLYLCKTVSEHLPTLVLKSSLS